jgi:hypothetical protein
MAYAADAATLKAWEDGRKAAIAKNPAPWNSYDSTIKSVIADYTTQLSSTPGYSEPDWKLVKAMLWTESGATNPAWSTAPMQAGMAGDTGLPDILPPNDHSKLILPPSYATTLTIQNVPKNPTYNIMAGVGILLKHAAKFGYVAVLDAAVPQLSLPPRTIGVQSLLESLEIKSPWSTAPFFSLGGSYSPVLITQPTPRVASHAAPHAKHPPKPKKKLGITGWRTIDSSSVAALYNGGGDATYTDKIKFVLTLM